MKKNYHEQLVDSIVKDIMLARNEEEYDKTFYDLDALCNASIVAKGTSLLEKDLERLEKDKFYYNKEDINKIINRFSGRVGKKVNFRTLTLVRNLESRLIDNLQVRQDPWETAKLVYSLGYLHLYANVKKRPRQRE